MFCAHIATFLIASARVQVKDKGDTSSSARMSKRKTRKKRKNQSEKGSTADWDAI